MSNSTRTGGYDERLVVPLEASRRGAHRARVNPLVAALPLLAVVVVVVGVVVVAYSMFFKSTPTEQGSNPPPTSSVPATGGNPSPAPGGATSSPSPSSTAPSTSAKVDKTIAFTVFNGSVAKVPGLAAKANNALKVDGFAKGQVLTSKLPVPASRTTRIYYSSSATKATAEAIKAALGVGTVKASSSVAAQGVVVVVGDDYAG